MRSSQYSTFNSRHRARICALRPHLDRLYAQWNRPEFISPDPLQFAIGHKDLADREITGLIASSLAFGNVKQILASIRSVLDRVPQPAHWLDGATPRQIIETFADFRHRYSTGAELAALLTGAKYLREEFGSLGAALHAGMNEDEDDISPALARFVAALKSLGGTRENYLLPDPARGSACKRLHLYLRWMVRCDDVDPGGWPFIPASKLLIPVDTHIHRLATRLRLTGRNAADLRTSREITAAFRLIAPEDPVRYDFALTRLGIRSDTTPDCFLAECNAAPLRQGASGRT